MKEDPIKIDKKLMQIEKFDNLLEKLSDHFTSIYYCPIIQKDIFDALFILSADKYDLEWPGDLWDVDIDYDEALKLLSNFDFNTLQYEISIDKEILPSDILIRYKVRIKDNNLIWIIHKNDTDPFPSNPHAHQLSNNIKLDLRNGKCYKRKKYIYKIRKKDLLKIRAQANDKEIELPEIMI